MKIKTKHTWLILIIFIGLSLFQIINVYTDLKVKKATELEKNGVLIYSLMGKLQAGSYELQTTSDLSNSFSAWKKNKDSAVEAVEKFLSSEFFAQDGSYNDKLQQQHETTQAGWEVTKRKLDDLEKNLDKYAGMPDNNNKGMLIQLYEVGGENIFHANMAVNSAISSLNVAFTQQYIHLVDEISTITNRQFKIYQYLSVGFTVIVLLLVLTLLIFIVKSINLEISKIETGIIRMKGKELSDRIEIASNSEIAKLGEDVNDFTEALGMSLAELKVHSEDSIRTKESLVESVTETAASTEQMKNNLQSIIKEVNHLNENINDSTTSTSDNLSKIKTLSEKIENQMGNLQRSEDSISKISSTIQAVSSISNSNVDQVQTLVQSAKVGGEKLQNTTSTLNGVYNSITEINKIIGIIQTISAQTNLLAMNAAIEAAHAGESGRGFSVVADEIRKLAEASQHNSKEITDNIKEITENISLANASGNEMQSYFREIEKTVEITRDSFLDIYNSTQELNKENKLIKDNMDSLIVDSRDIKTFFQGVEENSYTIEKELQSISEISDTVTGAISEVSSGLDQVADAMGTINEVSQNIDKISSHLDDLVNEFIID